ncbi:MAG: flagellar basal body-associated FliL family protein [Phycisphaeraceae bacterium]
MPEEESPTEAPPAKKRLPKKMLIVIAIVMVVEGAVIGGGAMLFAEKKPAVASEGIKEDAEAKNLELVEVLLIGDKFQNTRQGAQAYLYDATIYVVVRRQDQGNIEAEIEANMARISEEVTEIFARAEPAQLREPEKLTLKRQIKEKCEKRFGDDPEGEPLVKDIVISNWKRFSSDL